MVSSGLVKPQSIRFFVGYSGWSEGQLADELQWGSWVIADMHPNYLFKSEPEKLWQEIMNGKGDTYSVIAQMPDGTPLN